MFDCGFVASGMMKQGKELKSKGNYGYSEAVTATWQGEAGRTDGVTRSDGIADMYCQSIVKTADGGVLPSRQWSVATAMRRRNFSPWLPSLKILLQSLYIAH